VYQSVGTGSGMLAYTGFQLGWHVVAAIALIAAGASLLRMVPKRAR